MRMSHFHSGSGPTNSQIPINPITRLWLSYRVSQQRAISLSNSKRIANHRSPSTLSLNTIKHAPVFAWDKLQPSPIRYNTFYDKQMTLLCPINNCTMSLTLWTEVASYIYVRFDIENSKISQLIRAIFPKLWHKLLIILTYMGVVGNFYLRIITLSGY